MLKFMFGGGCKYKITCSEYTVRQIEKKGFVLGGLKGLKRVIKCNSFNKL